MAKGFKMQGVKDIDKVLAGLPGRFGEKVVRDTLKKGAKPLIKRAKALSSNSDVTGNLTKSIGAIENKGGGRTGQITVGPRRGGRYKGYHAHFLEYGTAPRRAKGKVLTNGSVFFGKEVAGIAPQPFMRPAYDEKIDEVQNEIAKEFQQILKSGFKNVFK